MHPLIRGDVDACDSRHFAVLLMLLLQSKPAFCSILHEARDYRALPR
jgi:hypothetical protein